MTQAQNVETRLREMILNMEIGPGERLTERWAEAQLGASRTPVRAALLRLETDGLICREGRGWMVTPLDIQEIEQLFVYREVLEVAAIQLAAKHANIEALDQLEATLEARRPGTSTREAHQLGTEFHVQLAALAANDFITRGVADAMTRLSRARWLDTTPEHQGWDEHRAVLAALREGDAAKASALVSQHLRDSRDRLMKILTEGRRSLRARGIMVERS
ncbi:GntR family transcriptional regulator [Ralstonia nicotianae]|uniref:GntR family transcriptional regulator n=1 Tax=Ralstonia pseudosolanacearum TaxID=1310165 RepID=UPI0026759B55|nr:GntR family transcriptional regulator [Ralstonia pseudosolanacearum]MDO3546403.1 GntR family transcriptional regulator [Ralstonia pseudosolanacearum]MDO3583040.1 GntR family transcriptional regulator [Ralstonia pseudosolanacearum]MDO3590844.1 GntR family transcriptional regulator [Ralstonia pseudosolanacearum]MDO3595525.1 GntR family transcriptional regulator [Ralstonia pseudosolanacearum]MDO3600166.1 GntR family transcriptional regulator [Ralstonia pseudosolanacearum]